MKHRMSAPATKSERSFEGWVPVHVFRSGPQPQVLWSRLGATRFTDSFFTQTVTTALQSPLFRFLQRTTSLDELVAASECEPAVEPAGFIFHVSRCGSTLVSQMFARLPRIIAISEAQPLMAVSDDPRLSDGDRARAFRALIRLYGRKVTGGETASVFKFGLRELFQWRKVTEIFPHVPRIVLHRDPIEVLVSNFAQPSEATLPGNLPPEVLGAPPRPLATLEDYAAFVFSRVYAHAADAARAARTLAVDYTSLPDAVESLIAPHFGITLDENDRAAMRGATRLHVKYAERPAGFVPDSQEKQEAAEPSTRAWVANHFQESWASLRAMSQSPGTAIAEEFREPLVGRMVAFLRSIGIAVNRAAVGDDTILPGIALVQGSIHIDETRLLYPGDILHEAGHLAVTPAASRPACNGNLAVGGGEEMGAIAWSYAAALHLGIDPAIVFHPNGYRSGSDSLLENFGAGRYLAVPLLQWMGLAFDDTRAAEMGCKPYPHMIRWLRP